MSPVLAITGHYISYTPTYKHAHAGIVLHVTYPLGQKSQIQRHSQCVSTCCLLFLLKLWNKITFNYIRTGGVYNWKSAGIMKI